MRKLWSIEVDGVAPGVTVIGQDDLEKWGCPFCGYRSGSMPIQCGAAGSWRKACFWAFAPREIA